MTPTIITPTVQATTKNIQLTKNPISKNSLAYTI